MNYRNFSLDYLHSSGGAPQPSQGTLPDQDPWAESVRYYGRSALKELQQKGARSVKELFIAAKKELNSPDLQINQFENVIWRMINGLQIEVVEKKESLADSLVALPMVHDVTTNPR